MNLFHKKLNNTKDNDPIFRLMAPMIIGIIMCIFCLVSMTWALFSASVNTNPQPIQSATRNTSVVVYEIGLDKENKPISGSKTKIMPQAKKESYDVDEDDNIIISGDVVTWKLAPEKTYEVVMTGGGTATTGYCKVAMSQTVNGSTREETKQYTTSPFEQEKTIRFTYNTGGFSDADGITATQYMEYIETTTAPTLAIASYWGSPAEEKETQASTLAAKNKPSEVLILSDGDVLGLAPIPCPEAKAETELELDGFEIIDGEEISAEEDYQISLTLKDGYEMPSEVIINIDGKDYVVSTADSNESDKSPYFDSSTGVLTVPSSLLSDGITVSVKATASPVPDKDELEEVEELEEVGEETETTTEETEETEETPEDVSDTEETTEGENSDDNNTSDTTDDNMVADDPSKKEEDDDKGKDTPSRTPSGRGGNDDDDDEDDGDDDDKKDPETPSTDNNQDTSKEEKADVKVNLSQLTINLEETKIPTNADLVFTLSAKEDMELPEKISITLDKTIRDENSTDEEIREDKTEYIIFTDGEDNPEGFEYDPETCQLTISSDLLKGVREITICDIDENNSSKDEEKTTISFDVTNLTFDFSDDEFNTDEDIVIVFTAGEEYELPETITITIDGKEYIIYTREEDSDKNPDGITFDPETGTLTIPKDLLKDAKAITITAEGIKKEDDESEGNDDNSDENKDDPKEPDNKEDETEEENGSDKENEGDTNVPSSGDKTETETGSDNKEDGTDNKEDVTEGGNGSDKENEGETDKPSSDDNTETETGSDNKENEGGTSTSPDSEGGNDGDSSSSAESTSPSTPSTPSSTPGTSNNNESSSSSSGSNGSNSGSNTDSGTNDSGASSSDNSQPSAPTGSSIESSSTSSNVSASQSADNTTVKTGSSLTLKTKEITAKLKNKIKKADIVNSSAVSKETINSTKTIETTSLEK